MPLDPCTVVVTYGHAFEIFCSLLLLKNKFLITNLVASDVVCDGKTWHYPAWSAGWGALSFKNSTKKTPKMDQNKQMKPMLVTTS